jgi:two-component system sensor histidine kinase RstB
MKSLFIRFYLGVLAVLFLAWYLYGLVLKERADADRARVVSLAHGGGVRLAARELADGSTQQREMTLKRLRESFAYPVEVIPSEKLSAAVPNRSSAVDGVLYYPFKDSREGVAAMLPGGTEAVLIGPFPSYNRLAIEDAIGGWMRLVRRRLDSQRNRQSSLEELQQLFDFPVRLTRQDDLPQEPRTRIESGDEIVFYSPGDDRWFAATPLLDRSGVIRFGPFPNFERNEQKAATTTLALVLLPAALAIALLLRPVARQLRLVEAAAKKITAGDLSARVDEGRIGSAKPLALAFNNMAARTEALVRTQRELLQAVSHELRTPLSRMRFAIELIETAKDEAERKSRLESLDAATEELDELVESLLRYVRMETAEPPLNIEQVFVRDAIDASLSKHAELHSGIDFRSQRRVSQEETPIHVDRLGFQCVLGNLLSNAGRHAKSKVTISTTLNENELCIDVDDDGPGIPESERERVLEPFVQLDYGTRGQKRGVGLGLALVKRIVSRHGGRVELLSSPLGGCRVRATWPTNSK